MAQAIRKTLRSVRLLSELTQAEMSQRIGMSAQAYGRFERGSPSIVPSAPTLRRMYEVLCGSLHDLLGPEGTEAPRPAAKPSSGRSRPRPPASPQRPGSHSRTRQTRRLALRVDVE
ncbi:helix-turn-helix transcriptional regulator [Archangium minus]|uniref:helix-turn-helix transcriptional regulator n=1 Tax=Archangium TaxID=47 RepID=UPI0037C04F4C